VLFPLLCALLIGPLAVAGLVCSCLRWKCKPQKPKKTKATSKTILPPVLTFYYNNYLIRLTPARLPLCGATEKCNQKKRHLSMLVQLFYAMVNHLTDLQIWNAIPISATHHQTISSLKRNLKTFYFAAACYFLPCATSDYPRLRFFQLQTLCLLYNFCMCVFSLYVCIYLLLLTHWCLQVFISCS